jgi:hypothetical protein
MVADVGDGIRVKLLLRSDFDETKCNQAQEAFLKFLEDLHGGALDVNSIEGLVDAHPVSNTLLLELDAETGRLAVVDPLPKHIGSLQDRVQRRDFS